MFVNVMDYGSQCVSVLWPEGLRGGVEMEGHEGTWRVGHYQKLILSILKCVCHFACGLYDGESGGGDQAHHSRMMNYVIKRDF